MCTLAVLVCGYYSDDFCLFHICTCVCGEREKIVSDLLLTVEQMVRKNVVVCIYKMFLGRVVMEVWVRRMSEEGFLAQ